MKKTNVRNILVPIDFSGLSDPAIEIAKGLARRFEATVHLAHVHQFYYPAGFMAPGTFAPMSFRTYREAAARHLTRKLAALAKRHGLKSTDCHLRNGDAPIFDEICRLARDIPSDLIVMSTHGYTGITHFFEGSNAERIVQHAPCPVLVRKQTSRGGLKKELDRIDKILVPVDFSRCSFEALKYAIRFADKVAAKILVFHAVSFGFAYTADGFAMYDLSALQETARKGAERAMTRFVREAKFVGVKFETVVTIGSPVDDICALTEKKNVDLIITATHGCTGFRHVMIGSTAEKLVRRADRPVLVVPSHPDVRAASVLHDVRQAEPRTVLARKQRPLMSRGASRKKASISLAHPFPERRKTNKFRESHLG